MVKNLPANTGDVRSVLALGRYRGEGDGNPLQYCCLGNPMHRGAWWAAVHGAVHGAVKIQTQLSNGACMQPQI